MRSQSAFQNRRAGSPIGSSQKAAHTSSNAPPSSPSPVRNHRTTGGVSSLHHQATRESSPAKSPTKPLVRYARRDRRHIDHALYSSLSESTHPREAAPIPTFPRTGRDRKSPATRSQSKLEAFGYSRLRIRETREFDTAFSDEEDLNFDDLAGDCRGSSPIAGTSLCPVPSAPPHPALRPSGVREMTKREKAAEERYKAQRESLRSSDSSDLPPPPSARTTSSSDADAGFDDPQISESARAWWDRLGRDDASDDML